MKQPTTGKKPAKPATDVKSVTPPVETTGEKTVVGAALAAAIEGAAKTAKTEEPVKPDDTPTTVEKTVKAEPAAAEAPAPEAPAPAGYVKGSFFGTALKAVREAKVEAGITNADRFPKLQCRLTPPTLGEEVWDILRRSQEVPTTA